MADVQSGNNQWLAWYGNTLKSILALSVGCRSVGQKKKLYEFSVQLHDNDQNAATQTSGLGSLQYFQQLLIFLSV